MPDIFSSVSQNQSLTDETASVIMMSGCATGANRVGAHTQKVSPPLFFFFLPNLRAYETSLARDQTRGPCSGSGVLTIRPSGKPKASPIFKTQGFPGQCIYPRPHITKLTLLPHPMPSLDLTLWTLPRGISVNSTSISPLGRVLLAGPETPPAPLHCTGVGGTLCPICISLSNF